MTKLLSIVPLAASLTVFIKHFDDCGITTHTQVLMLRKKKAWLPRLAKRLNCNALKVFSLNAIED